MFHYDLDRLTFAMYMGMQFVPGVKFEQEAKLLIVSFRGFASTTSFVYVLTSFLVFLCKQRLEYQDTSFYKFLLSICSLTPYGTC